MSHPQAGARQRQSGILRITRTRRKPRKFTRNAAAPQTARRFLCPHDAIFPRKDGYATVPNATQKRCAKKLRAKQKCMAFRCRTIRKTRGYSPNASEYSYSPSAAHSRRAYISERELVAAIAVEFVPPYNSRQTARVAAYADFCERGTANVPPSKSLYPNAEFFRAAR